MLPPDETFQAKTVCLDAVEKALAQLHTGVTLLPLHCEIHGSAGAIADGLKLQDNVITEVIRIACFLRMRWRSWNPAEAGRAAMHVFLGHSHASTARLLLAMLPNVAEWRLALVRPSTGVPTSWRQLHERRHRGGRRQGAVKGAQQLKL